ncbi:MAG: hypothetical protein FJ125_14375 [Deltaproteobacteria bacterium]|nr:hypothetical protein [Deltaproteobacteria bacterium]
MLAHQPASGVGLCTFSCAGYCPDRAGFATTFCAPTEALGGPPGAGTCVARAGSGQSPCGGRDDLVALVVERYRGSSGAAASSATVCAPVEALVVVPPLRDDCAPITIAQLPFVDSRNTSERRSSCFDRYSCAPTTNESGGDFVYVLRNDVAGTLSVAIDERPDDGIDIDVHLLSDLSGDACVARNDERIVRRIEPGTWYLVADTWVDRSGKAYPGPFRLTVDFQP